MPAKMIPMISSETLTLLFILSVTMAVAGGVSFYHRSMLWRNFLYRILKSLAFSCPGFTSAYLSLY